MNITPLTPLETRAQPQAARSELMLRYAAAYACTLIAIAGGQLILPNFVVGLLALVTLIGLPISLFLRWSNLRVFGMHIPRLLINSAVVVLTGVASLYFILFTQPELFTRGLYQTIMISHGAGESVALLMDLFLIFAAIRSLAILNDKDAVLSAVPSFSVLLLLIVVHRGPQVVAYFLLWALAAAILFSLDHRQESRQNLSGVVPSLIPHQDLKLSARGLLTVMSFSLICAIGISAWLSNRNPNERGVLESWILGMAGRMTQLALSIPDVSVNAGPERQIDFASGPALPTRTELWSVTAFDTQRRLIRPDYWRMFTLSVYNGTTWSQNPGAGYGINKQWLSAREWPPLRRRDDGGGNANGGGGGFGMGLRRRDNSSTIPPGAPLRRRWRNENNSSDENRGPGVNRRGEPPRPNAPGSNAGSAMPRFNLAPPSATTRNAQQNREQQEQEQRERWLRWRRPGYNILGRHPQGERIVNSFGAPRTQIYQVLEPRISNVGYLPLLPATRGIRITDTDFEELPALMRVRQDGAIDAGVVVAGQRVVVLSDVAAGATYGVTGATTVPPLNQDAFRPNPRAVLTARERAANLQLPARLMAPGNRVNRLARQALATTAPDDTNLRRAQLLTRAVQQNAVYTLHPPQIPENVDAAEYFLFENRRGYCTYFAGALTVLCRSAGIPARVVSGFVNPEWIEGQPVGVLREANAHAWTEVWIEGWGWATIDATPPGERGDNAPEWWENWNDLFGAVLDNGKRWIQANRFYVAGLLLMALAICIAWAFQRGWADPLLARLNSWTRGKVKLTEDQARRLIFKAYERTIKILARKFRPKTSWETPHEYLAAARGALDLQNFEPLTELTNLYARARYSNAQISGDEGKRALEAHKRLSWRTKR